MMKYKGYYWTILSPMLKKSITKRFSKELADTSIKKGKKYFKELLSRADDVGKGNPMEVDAYFAYLFVGVWLGSDKKISPDDMGKIMADVLVKLKPLFGLLNLNTKWGEKYWYRTMKKYEAWSSDKFEKYPTTWKVGFDESLHKEGSYYYFTQCPICTFCNKEGFPEIMKPLCETDKLMFAMQHGTLHRKGTIASGAPICDYWITGNKYDINLPENK